MEPNSFSMFVGPGPSNPETRLSRLLHQAAAKIRAEFRVSESFSHHGELGTVRQEILVRFLKERLPGHVEIVNSAELVTVDGQVSRQCDLVVFDRSTPAFLDMGTYRLIPNECVYGVIEVKSQLNKTELLDACEKIKQAKQFPKTAFHDVGSTWTRTVHGRRYSYCPTVGLIFAYGGDSLETLGEHLLDWCDQNPVETWPEGVWVLGKGYLTWLSPVNGAADPFPDPGSGLVAVTPESPEQDIVFPLMLNLGVYFTTAWMPPLNLAAYAGEAGFGLSRVLRQPDFSQGSPDANGS